MQNSAQRYPTTIHTPRLAVQLLQRDPAAAVNPSTCTKIPYKGYVISIFMRAVPGSADLAQSTLRITDAAGADVTPALMPEYAGVVPATAEVLKEVFAAIEDVVDPT